MRENTKFTSCADPELLFSNGAMPDIRTYTFEPSDPPKRIDIMVLDDDIVEDVEAHLVQLRVPKGETGVNLPQDSVIINVLDDGDSECLCVRTFCANLHNGCRRLVDFELCVEHCRALFVENNSKKCVLFLLFSCGVESSWCW